MANEKRLIDVQTAKAFIAANWPNDPLLKQIVFNLLDKLPTVDSVEVVRCKDCKEWLRNRGVVDSPNGHCFYHETHMNGYDFCSYGERRTDDRS